MTKGGFRIGDRIMMITNSSVGVKQSWRFGDRGKVVASQYENQAPGLVTVRLNEVRKLPGRTVTVAVCALRKIDILDKLAEI